MASKRTLRRGTWRSAKWLTLPRKVYRRIVSRKGRVVLRRITRKLPLAEVAGRLRKTSRRFLRKAIRQVRH